MRLILFILFISSAFYYVYSNINKPQQSSFTTFAGSQLRSGYVKTKFDVKSTSSLKELEFSNGKESEFSILFLNGRGDAKKYFPNKKVIILTSLSKIKAVDLEFDEELWSYKLANPSNQFNSTPVVDLEGGHIYALTRKSIQQIDFRGKLVKESLLNLNELLSETFQDKLYKPFLKRVNCKTSLGLESRPNHRFLYFGCSMSIEEKKKWSYGGNRGTRGAIIRFPILNNLVQDSHAAEVLVTSQLSEEPWTGFDSGVYLAGGALNVLKDGSILVATGNGPVDFEKNNFGCSIFKVNGNNFKPVKNLENRVEAFSLSQESPFECWTSNIEYSNSAIAVIEGEQPLAAVTSKHGSLTIFDPYNMNSRVENKKEIQIGQQPTYGQPVIFKNKNNKIQVIAKSEYFSKVILNSRTLVTKEYLNKLDRVSKKTCIGYLFDQPSQGRSELTLMYSGQLRDKYITSVKDIKYYSELKSYRSTAFGARKDFFIDKDLWATYQDLYTLGFTASVKDKKKYKFIDVDLNHYNQVYSKINMRLPIIQLISHNDNNCEKDIEGMRPVYLASRYEEHKGAVGVNISSYELEKKSLSVKKLWAYQESSPIHLHRDHPLAVIDINSNDSYLIFTAFSAENESILYILNGENGELVSKVNFNGTPHFSMPMVIDDKIFISIRNEGLKVFTIN